MLDTAELEWDLVYLQEKHGISPIMTDGLMESPTSANIQIQQYKMKMLGICLLFISMGGSLIVIALLRHEQWIGLLSGMIGSVIIVYAFGIFKKMKSGIYAIEKVARYHELL